MRAFVDLVRLTLSAPRQGLRQVLGHDLPAGAGLIALVLVAVVAAILLHLMMLFTPGAGPATAPTAPELAALEGALSTPFAAAAAQFVLFLIMAGLVQSIGRSRGGTGRMNEAMLAMAWLEAVMLTVQLVAMLIMAMFLLIAPPLFQLSAGLLMPVMVGLFFWLLASFVAELHGFPSVFKVLAGVVMTLLVMSFALTFVLATVLGLEA